MNKTTSRRSAAFTLPDTLVGVTLSMVTLVLSVPLVQWCSVSLRRTENAAVSTASFDHAIDLLRHDVWQAHQIHLVAADHLQLSMSDGQIIWRFDTRGLLHRRSPTGGEQHWQSDEPGIHFGQAGQVVTVVVPDSPGHPGSVLAMPAPSSLYTEAHP